MFSFLCRTCTRNPRTASPAIPERTYASSPSRRRVRELEFALTVNTVIHRANIDRVADLVEIGRVARRRASGNRARPILRLGLAESSGTDADARTGHARDAGDGEHPSALSGPSRDRSGRAGLLRAQAEGLHGRLGASLTERHALRPRAAVPRCRKHSRPAVLVGSRPLVARHMEKVSSLSGIPRYRLDAGALPLLRDARHRLWRMSLPGDGDHWRRGGNGSGMRAVTTSCADAGACRSGIHGSGRILRVSWACRARRGYFHSSSLKAAVALRAL